MSKLPVVRVSEVEGDAFESRNWLSRQTDAVGRWVDDFKETFSEVAKYETEAGPYKTYTRQQEALSTYLKDLSQQDSRFEKYNADSLITGGTWSVGKASPRALYGMYSDRDQFEKDLIEAKKANPNIQVKMLSDFEEEAATARREAELKSRAVEGPLLAQLGGGMFGVMSDPIGLATMAVGFATPGGAVAKIVGGAASSALGEAAYQSTLKKKPVEEKILETAMAGIFGGALIGAGLGVKKAVGKLIKTKGLESIAKSMDNLVESIHADKTLDPELKAVMGADIQADANLVKAMKLGDTKHAATVGWDYLNKSIKAFNEGRFADIEDLEVIQKRLSKPSKLSNREAAQLRGMEKIAKGETGPSATGVLDEGQLSMDIKAMEQGIDTLNVKTVRARSARVAPVFDDTGKPMLFKASTDAERALRTIAADRNNLESLYSIQPTKTGMFAIVEPTDVQVVGRAVFNSEEAAQRKITEMVDRGGFEPDSFKIMSDEDGYKIVSGAKDSHVLAQAEDLPQTFTDPHATGKIEVKTTKPQIPEKITEELKKVLDNEPVLRYNDSRIDTILDSNIGDQFAVGLKQKDSSSAKSFISKMRTVIDEFNSCIS